MNMKLLMTGLVGASALLAYVSHAQESLVEALSRKGYAAYDRLINARTFGSAHGIDGSPTDDLQSNFRILMDEPLAVRALERMVEVGSPAARMYGLYGLKKKEATAEFKRAVARLQTWKVDVEMGGDDTGDRRVPMQDLIRAISASRVFEIGDTFGIRKEGSKGADE